MKKLLLALLVVASVMLTSCGTTFFCKRCPTTTTHTIEIKDTVIIKEILKDTTITVFLPADSVITVMIVTCDSLGMAQMAETVILHKNMIATLKIKNGKLYQNITHLMDSMDITIQYKEREITNLKSRIENLSQVKEKEVKYIPWWAKILSWIGGFTVLAVLLIIAYNLNKIIVWIKHPFSRNKTP